MNPFRKPISPERMAMFGVALDELSRGTLPPSRVLQLNKPLRWMSQIDGRPKLQGLFRMADEIGFPVEISKETCEENGWDPDWVEALADAGRQPDPNKLFALWDDLKLIYQGYTEGTDMVFYSGLQRFGYPDGGKTLREACDAMYRWIWDVTPEEKARQFKERYRIPPSNDPTPNTA